MEIRQSDTFKAWLLGLRDMQARIHIARRISRAEKGNLGDVAPIGAGLSEMRIHHGPGYRLYFAKRGNAIVILLCAGSKKSQSRDIEVAKAMAKELTL